MSWNAGEWDLRSWFDLLSEYYHTSSALWEKSLQKGFTLLLLMEGDRKWERARVNFYTGPWCRNFKLQLCIISPLSSCWIVHEQLLSFWLFISAPINSFEWLLAGCSLTNIQHKEYKLFQLHAWDLLHICVSPNLTSRSRFLEWALTVTNVLSVKITLRLEIVIRIAWWEIHKKWSLEKDWTQFWWKFFSQLK